MNTIFLIVLMVGSVKGQFNSQLQVEIFDLTNPTTWQDLSEYYTNITREKTWKICYGCGFPKMGTTIHYLYYGALAAKPAAISVQYLLTRLVIIDVSSIVKSSPNLVLQLDDAQRWISHAKDTYRPSLLIFKFGWTEHPSYNHNTKCICHIPGISFELAAYIAVNLGHVVGVGTDTPSLESRDTRQTPTRTVSGILGKSGVYILENVNLTAKIPEKGCLATVMPLKLSNEIYVPVRVAAICPPRHKDTVEIILAQGDTRMNRLLN